MSFDPAVCASERVHFTEGVAPTSSTTAAPVHMLSMRCEDCGRFASTIVDAWPQGEAWIARRWSAHHARQMAERIAALEQQQGEGAS